MKFDQHHELQVLDILETEPEISQADLAARVAVSTVNWYLQSKKGYVKRWK